MGKKSPIWKYFEPDENPSKVKCKLCPEKISRGSTDPKKQTTSGMKNHLERNHKKEYDVLYPEPEKKSKSDEESDSETQPLKVKISKLRTQADRRELLKGTIPGWVESKNKLPFDSVRAKNIHRLIFEMNILDFQPFSIVNDAGFIRLMNFLEPRYEIPSDT